MPANALKRYLRITYLIIGLLFLANTPLCAVECRPCVLSAQAALKIGIAEAVADYWQTIGVCVNLPTDAEEQQCRLDAQTDLLEATEQLQPQYTERLRICRLVGYGPYAPRIVPTQFVDFSAVLAGQEVFIPNPYFPLKPGTVWEYIGYDDSGGRVKDRVEVLKDTKEILGVQCIVVHDQVWEVEGDEETLIEDTLDWYAQDLQGNVWYFGELSQEFDEGELVSLEGSWQAGRDGAQPGIIMFADPQPGMVYRQEFLIGQAEDVARVISIGVVTVTVRFGTFSENVLRTCEWSPLEPGISESKYYAPNVGLLLERNPFTGEQHRLVDMIPG